MINNEEVSNWLSAERKWDACKQWMHYQGKKISVATMRRAIAENGRTHRQRLAIDLMRQYYNHKTGPKPQSSFTPPLEIWQTTAGQ